MSQCCVIRTNLRKASGNPTHASRYCMYIVLQLIIHASTDNCVFLISTILEIILLERRINLHKLKSIILPLAILLLHFFPGGITWPCISEVNQGGCVD